MSPLVPQALRNGLAGGVHALRTPRGGDLLALLAGVALVPAFAPFGLWPLAALAPAALFLLWQECGRGRAAWRGWVFGVGHWGAGVYWIYHSLHFFGAAIAPLAAVLTLVFALGLALTLALLGALVASVPSERRGPAWLGLLLPGAWVLLEWFRSWFLTGFPWLLLGTSQVDTWLGGYAPVVGVYGTGLALALTAGLVAVAVRHGAPARVAALLAIAALWAGGWALSGVHWTRPSGLPFDAALVQGAVDQERKFASLERSLGRYMAMTRAAASRAELVVWPETAVPTYYIRVAERLNPFAEEMAAQNTHVVTGVFTLEPESGRYYNAVRELGPDRTDYRKRRLVPFGEYMPLRPLIGFIGRYIEIPMSDITAGAPRQPVLEVGRLRLGASVCYEAAYPDIIRSMAGRSGVLVNVSNDAWFGDSTAPFQHLQIARMRALETGRPMLRATNNGISAIIGPRGGVVARGPQFEPATVSARVEPHGGHTPFVAWGSWPALVAALALVVLPLAWRRLRPRH